MARFRNSNRQAADQMAYTERRVFRHAPKSDHKHGYYQRIGFDFAMI